MGGGLADYFQGVDIPPKLRLTAPAEGLGECSTFTCWSYLTRSPPALAEDEKGPEKRDAEALLAAHDRGDEMPKEFHVQEGIWTRTCITPLCMPMTNSGRIALVAFFSSADYKVHGVTNSSASASSPWARS